MESLSKIDQMFPCLLGSVMDDGCEKQLAVKVANTASAVSAKPSSADEERVVAHRCFAGARWPEPLARATSTHVMCGLMRRSLVNPATSQLVTRFIAGLFEVLDAVGGEVDADFASWWPFFERNGLIKEAFM